MALLAEHGLAASRARSQNFLFDRNVIVACLKSCNIQPGDCVLEIGPGLGHTTLQILEIGARVTAIELDRGFVPHLKSLTARYPDLHVVHGDATQLPWEPLIGDEPVIVIGNLPYAASSALLFRALRLGKRLKRLGVLVQREFAERMCALPRAHSYGRLSVMVHYWGTPVLQRILKPQVFFPRPQVTSAFVTLSPQVEHPVADYALLEQLVRAAFSQRRKVAQKAVAAWAKEHGVAAATVAATQAAAGIGKRWRAEEISTAQYVQWTNLLYDAGCR